jgi:hypothetical protein
VREIVAGLVRATDHFNKDKAAWRTQVIEVTGLKPDIAELAMGRGSMDYRLMLGSSCPCLGRAGAASRRFYS